MDVCFSKILGWELVRSSLNVILMPVFSQQDSLLRSAIMGAGLGKYVALMTDGRFSGGSHGFIIGHVSPEARLGAKSWAGSYLSINLSCVRVRILSF